MLLHLTEKNTNLGSVTAVNGKNSVTPQNMDPGKFLLLPPPTESILAKLGLPPPPRMDVGPYAYGCECRERGRGGRVIGRRSSRGGKEGERGGGRGGRVGGREWSGK